MIRIAYSPGFFNLRGPKLLLAVLAAVAGLLLAAIAALFAAATVVVVALVGGALLGMAALTNLFRRRPTAVPQGAAGEDGVIEARKVGGHEWVAYGWSDRDSPER